MSNCGGHTEPNAVYQIDKSGYCVECGDLLRISTISVEAHPTNLEKAAKVVLDEFNDWYDGPGYFPSSFVAAIIRLRRALENK